MVPPVDLQNLLVILGEDAVRLAFPEDACTRANKVVVKHPLVKGPLPTSPVKGVQGAPALFHALKSGALLPAGKTQAILKSGAPDALPQFFAVGEHCHPVIGFEKP